MVNSCKKLNEREEREMKTVISIVLLVLIPIFYVASANAHIVTITADKSANSPSPTTISNAAGLLCYSNASGTLTTCQYTTEKLPWKVNVPDNFTTITVMGFQGNGAHNTVFKDHNSTSKMTLQNDKDHTITIKTTGAGKAKGAYDIKCDTV